MDCKNSIAGAKTENIPFLLINKSTAKHKKKQHQPKQSEKTVSLPPIFF